ncbi:MAG TPA: hypothetical protein VJN43_21425 [Bryobacteraceae bacterium]|nr:hypothetical protein [Bryobacteraceae bacterium]
MRRACIRGVVTAILVQSGCLSLLPPAAWPKTGKPDPEPRAFSIFPLGYSRGGDYAAGIRGVSLHDAQAIWFETNAIQARVDRVERDPESKPDDVTPTDLVDIHVTVSATAKPGVYPFRVVTKEGVSNEISLRVVQERTMAEPERLTDEPGHAPRLTDFPLVVNGRIAKKGEVDYYWFEAQPGKELTFEAFSGFSAFDPAVAILEPSGSWFDPHRLNRIAFNDEPLYYPDFSTDAKLVHRFGRGGRYLVRVSAFQGRGSPNDVYELRISKGAGPPALLRAPAKPGWQEHIFTRRLATDWLDELHGRGTPAKNPEALETFRAVTEPAASRPTMKVPGIAEGVISKPAERQTIGFHVEHAGELALEVETPEATLPLFNPVIRVLDSGGREVITNVYTQLNNCGGFMMKTVQPKFIASFAEGNYTLEIHDLTTDNGAASFAYRVLVRPEIPHLGKVEVTEERVNLSPGTAKQVSVELEREENYSGLVALSVEGLPPGVEAAAGSEPEQEKPPLMNGGKVERYFPKHQQSVLLLTAAPDAPVMAMPQMVRVVVRPIVEGKVAAPISVKSVPVMVVAAKAEAAAAEVKSAAKR